jgi:hypothetical protein
VPERYDPATATPLIFDFHPWGWGAIDVYELNGMKEVADERTAIVVRPGPSLRSPHAPHKAERESEQRERESTSIRKYLLQNGGVQYIRMPVTPRACPRWPPAS